MTITFKQLSPTFMAEVSSLDLRNVHDQPSLARLRAGMTEYGVLVFKGQELSFQEQLDFAQRLDGELHAKTSSSVLVKNRFGNEALTDISNVGADGAILAADDRRRMNGISNRIWHTDASFEDPAGRYSMLFARNIPPVRADTEFADMRAAYTRLRIRVTPWDSIFRLKKKQSFLVRHIRWCAFFQTHLAKRFILPRTPSA